MYERNTIQWGEVYFPPLCFHCQNSTHKIIQAEKYSNGSPAVIFSLPKHSQFPSLIWTLSFIALCFLSEMNIFCAMLAFCQNPAFFLCGPSSLMAPAVYVPPRRASRQPSGQGPTHNEITSTCRGCLFFFSSRQVHFAIYRWKGQPIITLLLPPSSSLPNVFCIFFLSCVPWLKL